MIYYNILAMPRYEYVWNIKDAKSQFEEWKYIERKHILGLLKYPLRYPNILAAFDTSFS